LEGCNVGKVMAEFVSVGIVAVVRGLEENRPEPPEHTWTTWD
jgi:hypothetical protein